MNVRSATRQCWRAKRGVDKLAIGGMLRSDRVAGVCSSIIGAAPPMAKPGRARSRRVSRFKTGTGTHQPKSSRSKKDKRVLELRLKVIGSNRVPATTFIITHSPSRSNRRDGLSFSGERGADDGEGPATLSVTKSIQNGGPRSTMMSTISTL